MKELKRGDTLQVTIEAATVDGTGIARVDGQVVFVPGALPGERCSVRIAHVGRMRRNWNSSARTSIIA